MNKLFDLVRVGLPGLLVGLVATFAHAQPLPPPDARTTQYLASEPFKQLIPVVGMAYDQNLLERKEICATGYQWDALSFVVLQPMVFRDGDDHPQAGVWTFRFAFNRCGARTVYNVLMQGQPGKPPLPALMVPGLTLTSPRLAGDLMRGVGVAAALAGVPPDCKSVRILDTQVTAEPFRLVQAGKVREGVWQELWSARACGKPFTAEFCLTPQPAGGTDWALGKCKRQ
ncbi:MAG: hypothetical protein IPK34_04415 [Ramlibacter sp.]|nr:hypothetical protein [Ramlibacter sp.]